VVNLAATVLGNDNTNHCSDTPFLKKGATVCAFLLINCAILKSPNLVFKFPHETYYVFIYLN
jgi:hypothetical protein